MSSISRGILNGSLALTCQTTSAPPTNLKWYKDGSPINYDRDVYRFSQKVTNLSTAYYNNSLVFISDDAEDMIGEFKCRTSTTGISSSTISIRGIYFNTLIISAHQCDHHYNTGLQITTSNDPSRVHIIGSRISSIRCSSDLDVTRVEWYQGSNKVTSSYRSYSYLRYSGIVTTDDGFPYRCSAISPYVTQEKNITIFIIGK